MTDYEYISEETKSTGEEAIDKMINNATNSNQIDIFKSTFSTTDIVKECKGVDTVNQFYLILKSINIISPDGNLSEFSINNKFGLIFHGTNKKGEKYLQVRYTKKGKDFILNELNSGKILKNIDDVEVRYICKNNDRNEEIEAYVIIAFCQNEKKIFYKLNQKIKYENTAKKLIQKIKDKGIIDLKYWGYHKTDKLYSDKVIYWAESDFYLDYSDSEDDHNYNWYNNRHDKNYNLNVNYDTSEKDEVERMITNVSDQLGYNVSEDLARAFIHDMSKN